MRNWEMKENLKNILEYIDKIEQENKALKDALYKVLDSVKTLYAQCNVATEEIDQCRPTFDVDTAIRDRLIDRISWAILERINEISTITTKPSLIDDTVTYGVKINFINNTELEQLVKLLNGQGE
jgi:hypothetical protein